MQALHFWLHDDFCIFIEKRGGSYFRVWGHGRVAFAPGSYLDGLMADREMFRLRENGYQERLVTLDA